MFQLTKKVLAHSLLMILVLAGCKIPSQQDNSRGNSVMDKQQSKTCLPMGHNSTHQPKDNSVMDKQQSKTCLPMGHNSTHQHAQQAETFTIEGWGEITGMKIGFPCAQCDEIAQRCANGRPYCVDCCSCGHSGCRGTEPMIITKKEWVPVEKKPMIITKKEWVPIEKKPMIITKKEWVPVEKKPMIITKKEWVPVEKKQIRHGKLEPKVPADSSGSPSPLRPNITLPWCNRNTGMGIHAERLVLADGSSYNNVFIPPTSWKK